MTGKKGSATRDNTHESGNPSDARRDRVVTSTQGSRTVDNLAALAAISSIANQIPEEKPLPPGDRISPKYTRQ